MPKRKINKINKIINLYGNHFSFSPRRSQKANGQDRHQELVCCCKKCFRARTTKRAHYGRIGKITRVRPIGRKRRSRNWPHDKQEPAQSLQEKIPLVVDANIIIAGLLKNGLARKLLLSNNFKLSAPTLLQSEINRYLPSIVKKSGIKFDELQKLTHKIYTQIKFSDDFFDWQQFAESIVPDENDSEYFALAFSLNIPLWSNDKKLKEQSIVQVISTHELLEILSKNMA